MMERFNRLLTGPWGMVAALVWMVVAKVGIDWVCWQWPAVAPPWVVHRIGVAP